jgi:hypothetical protein
LLALSERVVDAASSRQAIKPFRQL